MASHRSEVDPLLYQLLVQQARDYALFLLDRDGRIVSWNLGAQRLKGYAEEEIVGRHFSIFYSREAIESGWPEHELKVALAEGRFEDEGWRVRKDGSRFWADVIVTALRDEAGKPYAYAKVTRDMTHRREAEEQRMALRAEQQSRVAAEEALAARDRFLSIASHELKTPIATLQLATESIARAHTAGRLDQDRLTTSLRRVSRATQRLRELVAELLDVSRLTGDTASLPETQPMDLVGLTREVAERFEEPDGTCRVHLTGPDQAWVVGDGGRLDQVITNLIDNALKYSSAPDRVEVDIAPEDDEVRLSVGDYGIGLDSPASAHLFEAFGRGKNAENIPGLGLGLYISEQIVARHGGRISAVPRGSGRGAIFSIWLPAAQPGGAHGSA